MPTPPASAEQRLQRRLGSNAGMVSYLAVPLVCLGRTIGVLQVDSGDRDAFDDIDVMLLEGLAAQTANAIESARYIDEITRLDGLKHAFINLVSHELRTPLTIASGMLHAYRQRRPTAVTGADDLLERGEAALARLARLIDELILMSQLTAGDLAVSHDPVRVRDVLVEVADRSEDPAKVTVDCPDELVQPTDRRLLARIVDALVENALVYAGIAHVVARPGVVEVHDDGPGLPADVLERVGEAFSRSTRNAPTVAGLGLGLSLVRALVGELGGEMALDSAPGRGTVVRVSFAPEGMRS